MIYLILALILQPPLSEELLAAELEAARRQCREAGSWPEFPARVEGCAVDWTDAESVASKVQWPSKRDRTAPELPTLPAGEPLKPTSLILEYWVSSSGGVEKVCVLRSVSPTVDNYFVELARRAAFRPGSLCGVPAPFSVTVVVNHHAWDWPREPRGDSPPNHALQRTEGSAAASALGR